MAIHKSFALFDERNKRYLTSDKVDSAVWEVTHNPLFAFPYPNADTAHKRATVMMTVVNKIRASYISACPREVKLVVVEIQDPRVTIVQQLPTKPAAVEYVIRIKNASYTSFYHNKPTWFGKQQLNNTIADCLSLGLKPRIWTTYDDAARVAKTLTDHLEHYPDAKYKWTITVEPYSGS